MKKFSFGNVVICAETGDEVASVWAATYEDAVSGKGVSDKGLIVRDKRVKAEAKAKARTAAKAKEDEQAGSIQSKSSESRSNG